MYVALVFWTAYLYPKELEDILVYVGMDSLEM